MPEEKDNKTYNSTLPENINVGKSEILAKMGDLNSPDYRHLRANGIYQPHDMQYDTNFYRLRRIDPYFQVEGGTEYLFFTKPDLNLLNSGGGLVSSLYKNSSIYGKDVGSINSGPYTVPYFMDLWMNGYQQTFYDLCRMGNNDVKCPFIRILSNRKVSNMDVPDIVTNEIETAQNMFGTRIFYPTSSMKSDEDVEFSIEFEDTQYLEIYHLFKAYDMYRQMKYLGLAAPKEDYIRFKILHDHMSIYKFIVDTDGETLLYYAKATGVYPKTISRSAFREIQDKGGLKITVSFKLSGWFEDMEPNIITDFNQLVTYWIGGSRTEVPLWDKELQAVSGENVRYFYIEWLNHKKYGQVSGKKSRYALKAGK
jgi:hypothetical protein